MKNTVNKIICISLAAAVTAIVLIVFISIKQSSSEIRPRTNTPNFNAKLQQCPDEWIDNQMPSADLKKSETQYFIFNGVRRELDEFDVEWIQKNCSLKKQVVY